MHNTPDDTPFLGVDVTFPERARWRRYPRRAGRSMPLGLWLLLALGTCVMLVLVAPGHSGSTSDLTSTQAVNSVGNCAGKHESVKRALNNTCPLARADIRADFTPDAILPPTDPQGILTQMTTNGIQGLIDFVKGQFLDWASSFGFMYITPASLTYKLFTVRTAGNWIIGVLDGVTALVLFIGGYNILLAQHLGLPVSRVLEVLPRLVLAVLFANLGFFYVLPQLIELNNALCLGVWTAFGHASLGDFTLPLGIGALNCVRQSFTLGLFAVIDFLVALLLVIEQLVRLGLLDMVIVFAPLGILCAALPQTYIFFRLWALTFFCTLFVQVLQVGTIALGAALLVSFGPASNTPVVVLVGIASMYIAFKLPRMLLSGALQASVGAVHRDLGTAVTGIANGVGFANA
jgi:hypothetical protein